MDIQDINFSAVLMRFLLGGCAVAGSYIISRILGGNWGGIFATFPSIYLTSIITVAFSASMTNVILLTQQISEGALIGMLGNIACAAGACFLIPKMGLKSGIFASLLIWFAFVTITFVSIGK